MVAIAFRLVAVAVHAARAHAHAAEGEREDLGPGGAEPGLGCVVDVVVLMRRNLARSPPSHSSE